MLVLVYDPVSTLVYLEVNANMAMKIGGRKSLNYFATVTPAKPSVY